MLIAALGQIREVTATGPHTAQMGAADRNFRVADFVGQVLDFPPR
jgi:hypothetical protein